MKKALPTLAVLSAMSAPATADQQLSPEGTPVEAQIRTLVSSITTAVDRGAYDLAQQAFAPQVVIDYTSVWGGEPAATTPADLMASWQTIVPGFDVTWHELGPVTIAVEGDTATAHAFVDARHWIDSDIWRPVGNYHWDVKRLDGEWRVTRMEFEMTDELGNRDLVAKAMERAK